MTAIVTDTVTLGTGLVVSLDALRLLWEFESRKCIVRREGEALVVGPRGLITDVERDRIRQHKNELLALIDYCEALQ